MAQPSLRNWINSSSIYKPAVNRYHLIASLGCPYASRCLIVRTLKGLQDVIGVTIVSPIFAKTSLDPIDEHIGWWFSDPTPEFPECSSDPSGNNFRTLREFYDKFFPGTKRFSVPVLFDKETLTIVNTESAEIMRILNDSFNEFATNPQMDLFPPQLADQINETNQWVYDGLNNGVYKAGLAKTQSDYDFGAKGVFETLDRLENILSQQRYVISPEQITDTDIRVFVSLIRFDEAYFTAFRCNKRRIEDYPNLSNYTRDIYQHPGVAATVNMNHIRNFFFKSFPSVSPFGIVPIGPNYDYTRPHNRESFSNS